MRRDLGTRMGERARARHFLPVDALTESLVDGTLVSEPAEIIVVVADGVTGASMSKVSLDVQGRILIPQILRESASVNGDVVVSGQLNHLVVWNHERFVARLSEQPFTDEDFHALSTQGI